MIHYTRVDNGYLVTSVRGNTSLFAYGPTEVIAREHLLESLKLRLIALAEESLYLRDALETLRLQILDNTDPIQLSFDFRC